MTEFTQWSQAEMKALMAVDDTYNLADLPAEIKTRSGSRILRSAFDVNEKVHIVRAIYKRKLRTGDFGSVEDVKSDMAASGYKPRTEAEAQKARNDYGRK